MQFLMLIDYEGKDVSQEHRPGPPTDTATDLVTL